MICLVSPQRSSRSRPCIPSNTKKAILSNTKQPGHIMPYQAIPYHPRLYVWYHTRQYHAITSNITPSKQYRTIPSNIVPSKQYRTIHTKSAPCCSSVQVALPNSYTLLYHFSLRYKICHIDQFILNMPCKPVYTKYSMSPMFHF